jgi:hypothetical protein
MEAINSYQKAFNIFKENIGSSIIGFIVFGILVGIVSGIAVGALFIIPLILGAVLGGAGGLIGLLIGGLIAFVVMVVGQGLFGGGAVSYFLALAAGGKPSVSMLALPPRKVTFIVYGILFTVVTMVTFGFGAWFTVWGFWMIANEGLGAIDALKKSVGFAIGNIVDTIVFFIVAGIAYTIGAVLFGIGLFAAIPVILLAQAVQYSTLSGAKLSVPRE